MSLAYRTFPNVEKRPYADLREDICDGDLLLCSGTRFFSSLISSVTNSVWSHVAFVLRLQEINRVMVLESVESQGVRTIPLSRYVRDYDGSGKGGYPGRLLLARHRDFAASARLDDFARYAVDRFGYNYDRVEIARIGLRIAGSLLGEVDDGHERNRLYICSEFVEECYASVGLNIETDSGQAPFPCDFARNRRIRAIAEIPID